MSRTSRRVLLTVFLSASFYLSCHGQVLPVSGVYPAPGLSSEPLVSKTHNLSPAIASHVSRSHLPEKQAKSNAITQLFAPIAMGPKPTKRTELRPGVFEVVAPESFHQQLAIMNKWMANGEKQITIESRILTVSEEKLRILHAKFGGGWEITTGQSNSSEANAQPLAVVSPPSSLGDLHVVPNPKRASIATSTASTRQFLPCRIASIGDQELKRIIQEAQSDTRTNVMQAPKVTIFPDQEAVISDTTQRPFVTSVKPSDDTAGAMMQPVITVLEDGLSMKIKASVVGDDEVQMDSSLILGNIGEVETFTFETPGRFRGTTVQIPEYTERKISISKKLSNNRSLIIDPHFVTDKVTKRRFRGDVTTRDFTIVILTARVIHPQSEQEEPKVAKL